MLRASALLVIVAVVAGVSGCASDPGAHPGSSSASPGSSSEPSGAPSSDPSSDELTGRASIEGAIVPVTASGNDKASYMLQTPDGYLALEFPPQIAPAGGRGVIVAVPADLELPADQSALFAVLSGYSTGTGLPLRVVALLN